LNVTEQQVRIDRRQQFSQGCTDATGCACHQDFWHFVPRLCTADLRSFAGSYSKLTCEQTQKQEQPKSDAPSHSFGFHPDTCCSEPAIHAVDPRFEKYWLKLSAVERLATGLRWAEGPVWFGDGRYLLCSDIPNQRILKWEEETGAVSIFRKPSNFANGNTRDR